MEKSPIFLGAVGNVDGQTGVSLALNGEHTRQRRALGHLFTNTALLQQESLLRIHVRKLVTVLKAMAAKNQPVDFSSWCKHLPSHYLLRLPDLLHIQTRILHSMSWVICVLQSPLGV